jgi:hypothetical protein
MNWSMKALCMLTVAGAGVFGARAAQATVITQWAFPATVAAPDNSPAPTTGVGTAISLGMDNNYTYAGGELGPSVTNDDITQPGSKKQLQDFTWRIRGNGNVAGPGANGWNNSAPNYTQGAEFEVSTAGASDITLSFDWYCTTQGVANMQVQYTLDDTQANPTWVNLGSDLIATSNNFFGAPATGGGPTNSFDLSSIAGVANDPNFAVEMVSVQPISTDANFATTPAGDYAAAAGGAYNNSSGNWSFGNITVAGVVPEPASVSLLGLTGLALLGRRRTKLVSR